MWTMKACISPPLTGTPMTCGDLMEAERAGFAVQACLLSMPELSYTGLHGGC